MVSNDSFRLRVLRTGSISLGILVTVGVVLRYWITPFHSLLAIINFSSGLVLLSIPFWLKRGVSRGKLTVVFLVAIATIGFSSGLAAGGVKAPAMLTMVLMPLLGYILSSHRGALIGLAVTFSTVALVLLAELNELVLPFLNEDRLSYVQGFMIFMIAFASYAIGRTYENSRTQTENELIERERQIRTVIDTSPVGMVVLNQRGEVQVLNRKASHMLPKLQLNSVFLESVPNEHVASLSKFLTKSPTPVTSESEPTDFLFETRSGDETIWIRLEAVPFASSHGDPTQILLTMRDVTEEVRADDMRKTFVANSKMAALGEMAGGVAHEINNPLSIIVGKCGTIRTVLRQDSFDRNRVLLELEKIANTAGRIAKITSGLLAFSRSGDQDPPSQVRVQDLIDETIAFCSDRFANAGISLDVNLGGHADAILTCRTSQISQVLLNLLNNAFDEVSNEAPPGKKQPEPWVRLEFELTGSTAHFIVTDGGFGLPDSIRDKIFNPFFTTKPVGFGTGLGLSISKGLIESHGGTLTYSLDRRSNLHTSFRASLPLTPTNAS